MRRLFLSIFTAGFFLGMLTGCQNFFCHTAGVCDCDHDDDPCTHRTPWVRGYNGGAPAPGVSGIASAPSNNAVPINNVPAQPVSRSR
ncbi:MAG: hypothetical protein WCL32_25815 [Planctomycetota bacterium]|jgi:hypothetical protein